MTSLVVALLAIFASYSPAVSRPQAKASPPASVISASPAPSASPSAAAVAAGWADFMDLAFASPLVGWEVAQRTSGARLDLVVRRTDDGGLSWKDSQPISLASGIPVGVRFGSPSRGWLYGPGLWTSYDGGVTWANTQLGGRILAVAPVGSSVWALEAGCAASGGCPARLIDVGSDGTDRRQLAGFPNSPWMSGLLRVTATTAYAFDSGPDITSAAIWLTRDGGTTWARLPTPCTPAGFGVPALATLDGVVLWLACPTQPSAGSQEKSIYSSADGGRNWQLRTRTLGQGALGSLPEGGYIRQLVLATPTRGFLDLSRYPMLVSTDSGSTWRDAGIPNEADGGAITPWFVDSEHGWAVTLGRGGFLDRHLWRTVDGGSRWSELPVPAVLSV